MVLSHILDELEILAPFNLSDTSFDNCGLQVGNKEDTVSGILLCLDVTAETVSYAVEHKINLIISHHPLLFKGIKAICFDDYKGRLLMQLIQNHINVFSMHTNLDAASLGMNLALSKLLKLKNTDILHITATDTNKDELIRYGYGLVTELEHPIHLNELAKHMAKQLDAKALRYAGQPSKEIKKIAICGGSGSSFIRDAVRAKADAYITGDIGHHDAQEALEQGLSIIDAGHYDTEKHVLNHVKLYLQDKLKTELPILIYENNEFAFHLPF